MACNSDVRPSCSLHNSFRVAFPDAELATNGLEGQSGGGAQLTDCAYIGLSQFGVAVPAATEANTVTEVVSSVLFSCCPSQIDGPIVMGVAVPMRNLMVSRRAGPVKGLADDDVRRRHWVGGPQAQCVVSGVGVRLEYNTRPKTRFSAIFVSYHAVERTDAPEAAGFVSWVTGDRAPLFLFVKGVAQ